MFQFPEFPPDGLCIHPPVTGLPPAGFPHSDIKGSMPACGSPLLFAACHVLLRRLVPWHPPCALLRLITLLRLVTFLSGFYRKFCNWSFQDSFSSFYVRLSRCAAGSPAFRVLFRILKTIQRTDDSFFLGLCLSTFVLSFALSRLSFTDLSAIDLGLKPPISLRLAP